MTTAGDAPEERWPFLQSLPFRVVAFLSLALLPIGLLAIWQNKNLDDTLRARTSLSLIALTELAISGERQTLQRAVGAASGQAVTYSLAAADPTACSAAFRTFRDADPTIAFAGFIPPDGNIACSSESAPFTVGPAAEIAELALQPVPALIPQLRESELAPNTVTLLQPVSRDDTIIGQIALALPTDTLSMTPDIDDADPPLSLIIFNVDGDIIVSEGEPLATERIDISNPAYGRSAEPITFVGRNADGQRRIYVVLTLVPGLAYAMTGWAPTEGFLASNIVSLPSFFLPALMWFASLLVAYFAVHRLVVSPIQDLRGRMRRFASDRALPKAKNSEMLPQELFDLEQTFVNMAYDLIDDEARMENSLREKNVLLKEVHHRVKNNLQMISSIMNMQIRTATTQESRHALKRLQDRVLGLATVHRYLYQSKDLARTDAAPLMADLCGVVFTQLENAHPGAEQRLEVDNFSLVPDQAVPLSLLIGEVGTNAIQHMTADPEGQCYLQFSLRIVSPGMAQFRCRNSANQTTGTASARQKDKGVGGQLIRAFGLQLGGKVDMVDSTDAHTISIEFPITSAIPDALDY